MNNFIKKYQKLLLILGCIIFWATCNFLAVLGTTNVNVPEYYATIKPSLAPPTWVFGVVWTFNTILMTYGLYLTICKYLVKQTSILRNFLILQGAIWVNYVVFQYLSFGLKWNFMFFFATFTMWIMTIGALFLGYKIDTDGQSFWQSVKSGKSITCCFIALICWLSLASAFGFQIWQGIK
jgi:tryptophan-rich sensory protein